ncbi:MAG: carbohydrate-binding domain-containing protein, partial [Oscillospiraceae bacterium]|nr:carbohydrate-binding domain-containing protein [Oscillospiraceae bacterium]
TQNGDTDAKSGAQTPTATAMTTASATAQQSTAASGDSCKGLKGVEAVYICGGTISIDSADDAVHSNGEVIFCGGTLSAASGDDGMHADGALSISGGSITISGSYEGLEGQTIDVSGGEIMLTASDDGLNAAGGNDGSSVNGRAGQNTFAADSSCAITISGGTLCVSAGGDGIDSNGDLRISGGLVLVNGPTDDGNGALDYAGSGSITGGVLIAAGSSGMAQSLESDTQGVLLVNLAQQSAGTRISLVDANGTAVLSWTPSKTYSCVVFSAPGIQKGGTYTIASGGEVQGADANGYASDASISGGTQLLSVTMSALTQTAKTDDASGSTGGMGGGMTSGTKPGRG